MYYFTLSCILDLKDVADELFFESLVVVVVVVVVVMILSECRSKDLVIQTIIYEHK